MKHIIFDCDGVLVDSFEFHLNKMREIYGIELTEKEYRDIHDGNFYDAQLKQFENIDFQKYGETVSEDQSKLPLNTNVKEVLSSLAEKYKLHLITSGWEIQIIPFLKNNDIFDVFSTCQYANNGKSKHVKLANLLKQEKASADEFIFITDTLGDLLEAQELNIPTIAVTFGYHKKERLLKGSPAHIVDSFDKIERILIPQSSS